MSETLYRKVGRRYEPVGNSHIGFPAVGVWIVTQGEGMRSERVFTNLGEAIPVMTYAAFERHRDVIAATINRVGQNLHSPDSMAGEIIKAVCLAEEAEDDAQECPPGCRIRTHKVSDNVCAKHRKGVK